MPTNSRYIEKYILEDLKKKMVFISGPRQCGKTTLVKGLIKNKQSLYLNWDDVQGRKKLLNKHGLMRMSLLPSMKFINIHDGKIGLRESLILKKKNTSL